jgi:hypothetical protein
MSEDLLGQVLAGQCRRFVRALCEQPCLDADPILAPEEYLDGEAYEELCYELHHVVLPDLAAEDVVVFDRDTDEVCRGPQFDAARLFLAPRTNGHSDSSAE